MKLDALRNCCGIQPHRYVDKPKCQNNGQNGTRPLYDAQIPVSCRPVSCGTMRTMVRPERIAFGGDSCFIELAGESPVAVSAEAPRSRPRAREEISSSEWGVKSPRSAAGLTGGEQVRRPSEKRSLQPRDMNTRKVVPAEPLTPRRRQQTAPVNRFGAVQDGRGVGSRACGHSSVRNRRGPSRLPTSGEGGPYKLMAKWDRAGRESEGFIVLLTPADKAGRGKGPCFGRVGVGR